MVFLYLALQWTWQLVQGVTLPLPVVCWPCVPELGKKKELKKHLLLLKLGSNATTKQAAVVVGLVDNGQRLHVGAHDNQAKCSPIFANTCLYIPQYMPAAELKEGGGGVHAHTNSVEGEQQRRTAVARTDSTAIKNPHVRGRFVARPSLPLVMWDFFVTPCGGASKN